MNLLKRHPFLLITIGICLLNLACSSTERTKQRDFTESIYLEDSNVDATLRSKKIRRTVSVTDYNLEVIPYGKFDIRNHIEKQAFKKNWNKQKTKQKLNALMTQFQNKSCFSIVLTSSNKDAATLDHFSFKFIDSKGLKKEITPLLPNVAPEAEKNIGSYSTGGYGYTVGDTVHYMPSQSNVYSYTTYSNYNFYCAKGNQKLTEGFMVLAVPRYKRNVGIQDLVWSVDPKDKETFKYWPGIPYRRRSNHAKAWLRDHRKALNEKHLN